MKLVGRTHIGKKRSQNEDTLFISNGPIGSLPNLCIIADGMGGHNGGEVASSKSVDFFCEYIRERDCSDGDLLDYMAAALAYANHMVHMLSMTDASLYGMGTTFTACMAKDDRLYVVHLGDSRLYSLSDCRLKLQTSDHTYVNQMIKAGQITPEQARRHPKRNILIRVLGVDAEAPADGLVLDTLDFQMILICSDGLTDMLTDEDIAAILNENTEPEQKADALVESANEQGGLDNISVILIDFLQD